MFKSAIALVDRSIVYILNLGATWEVQVQLVDRAYGLDADLIVK